MTNGKRPGKGSADIRAILGSSWDMKQLTTGKIVEKQS